MPHLLACIQDLYLFVGVSFDVRGSERLSGRLPGLLFGLLPATALHSFVCAPL